MYIELKSGHGDWGPARIGRVTFSKTGQTVYYGGKTFRAAKGRGVSGNFIDVDTGDEYWISGVKKNRQDRHSAGGGPVHIDDDVQAEYAALLAEGRRVSQRPNQRLELAGRRGQASID